MYQRKISKRREEYEKGIARLCSFLEAILEEEGPPSLRDIQNELDTIHSLRPLTIKISLTNTFSYEDKEFIFLLHEVYERYDDALPQDVEIFTLSQSMDNPKALNKYLSTH